MFNIFKKIKYIIMKKEEIEQQLTEAISVAQRLGNDNKELRTINENLIAENIQLRKDFDSAAERVRYLAGQLDMREAQQQASQKYNDNNRNY